MAWVYVLCGVFAVLFISGFLFLTLSWRRRMRDASYRRTRRGGRRAGSPVQAP